ncbi:MAG TPA: hypothetical protein VGD27_08765, partial [Longimicrobiales bacterium]
TAADGRAVRFVEKFELVIEDREAGAQINGLTARRSNIVARYVDRVLRTQPERIRVRCAGGCEQGYAGDGNKPFHEKNELQLVRGPIAGEEKAVLRSEKFS